jgi:RNA polymerase sigma-70 factor (ECF subfamily)
MAEGSEALIESTCRGDARAMEQLVERHLPGLRRYIERNAGKLVSAKESHSDLVQSVCRELFVQLGREGFQYQGEAQFKRWLYRAALRKIMNRQRFWLADRRDAGRERAAPTATTMATAPMGPMEPLHAGGTPSEDAALREDLAHFEAAFARLPENYREVLQLAQVDGLSHREIGERLGVTEAHSRVLLSRALAKLARLGRSGALPGAPPDGS